MMKPRTRAVLPFLVAAPLAALVACGGAAPAPAAPASSPAAPGADAPKAPGEAKVGDKTTCIVSGETFTVLPTSPKVEHGGKTYYFCCPGCDQEFAKNPGKFVKKT